MELQMFLAISVAYLGIGRRLWIQAEIQPLLGEEYLIPEDNIVQGAAEFFNVSFSMGESVVQIRLASRAIEHPPGGWHGGALAWSVAAVVGAVAAVATLVALSSSFAYHRSCGCAST